MKHRFGDQFTQTVDCNFQAIPAIIGVVVAGVGMIVQMSAANQAAQNAQAIANYNAMIQQRNAQIVYQQQVYQAQQAAAIAANNQAMVAAQVAVAAQNRDVGLQNAQILRDQVESVRMQQREEASRLREESERRIGVMRAKYGASGVTFEGSPLVVLADAARLAETQVQDKLYIAELESRKLFRAADITEYQAETEFALAKYGGAVQTANYQLQRDAAAYDTLIAGAKNKIALSAAELTRFEGNVQAQAYRAEGTQALISGIGGMASSIGSGMTSYQNSQLLAGLYK